METGLIIANQNSFRCVYLIIFLKARYKWKYELKQRLNVGL